MRYFSLIALCLAALFAVLEEASAQPGFLKEAIEGATGGDSRRNDLEGGIWE